MGVGASSSPPTKWNTSIRTSGWKGRQERPAPKRTTSKKKAADAPDAGDANPVNPPGDDPFGAGAGKRGKTGKPGKGKKAKAAAAGF